VREFFGPFRRGAVEAQVLSQLQCMYGYVQAAVEEGKVGEVLAALRLLLGDT